MSAAKILYRRASRAVRKLPLEIRTKHKHNIRELFDICSAEKDPVKIKAFISEGARRQVLLLLLLLLCNALLFRSTGQQHKPLVKKTQATKPLK